MTTLKHIRTFESFVNEVGDAQLNGNEFDMLDEGIKDALKNVANKIGMKVEDFMTQWKKPEMIEWAKRKAKGYLRTGKLTKEAYDKALAVNFDPSNPDARDFFVQMAKIKGALTGGPTSNMPTL